MKKINHIINKVFATYTKKKKKKKKKLVPVKMLKNTIKSDIIVIIKEDMEVLLIKFVI